MLQYFGLYSVPFREIFHFEHWTNLLTFLPENQGAFQKYLLHHSSTTATQTKHIFRPTSLFQSGWRPTDSSSIDPSLSFYGAPPSGVAVYFTTAPTSFMILKSEKLTPPQPRSPF